MELAYRHHASQGKVDFSDLGEIVECAGLLENIPVDHARAWVGDLYSSAEVSREDFEHVVSELARRRSELTGESVAAIVSEASRRLGASYGGFTSGGYMPNGCASVQEVITRMIRNDGAMNCCRALDLPRACACMLEELLSGAELWTTLRRCGGLCFPSSDLDVAQELVYNLVRSRTIDLAAVDK